MVDTGPDGAAASRVEGLSEYELERRANIARNEAVLLALGLGGGPVSPAAPARRATSKRRVSSLGGRTECALAPHSAQAAGAKDRGRKTGFTTL
eukprot:2549289-Prymnesium_polylepis.1